MIFDLTPEIIPDKNNQKKYLYARTILFVLALAFAFYAAFTIIFPTRYFSFSFLNPNSTANTITSPRDENGNAPDRGKIIANRNFLFDSTLLGNFSEAKIIFRLNKKSTEIEGEDVSVRRSYQAFLYPEEKPIGFKDGALLKNKENYYIVSDEKLRKFDTNILSSLGFNINAFEEVSADELKYNVPADDISNADNYPNGSLFKINQEYYLLMNENLTKFISEKAYLSQYSAEMAIEKSTDFLQKYSQNESEIGFADGSLVAYGESAFVVSDNKSFPIDSIETFEALGYSWADLITVGGDEASFYTKEQLLDLSGAHPNGTVFLISGQTDFGKKYIIKNGTKHLLPSEKIAASWSKTNPIAVSAESLATSSNCNFGKKWLLSKTYSCEASVDGLQNLLGKDYKFSVVFGEDIKVDSAELQFKKSYTLSNLKRFTANVIKNIKNNYVGQD